jgi:hypothetical protein
MKLKIIILFLLAFAAQSFTQTVVEREGTISFISSQNIYAKFSDTDGLSEGDTLYIKRGDNLVPAVKIQFLSKTSAAGESLNGSELKVGDLVYMKSFIKEPSKDSVQENLSHVIDSDQVKPTEIKTRTSLSMNEKISGRFSIQSYSNLSNSSNGDFQRWRYTVSFRGLNISESSLSVFTHLNFNYKADNWSNVKQNPGKSIRVYDLAAKYDFSEKYSVIFGRHLNRKITNISSIDGIQFNGSFGIYETGIFLGSRPDFSDHGFNLKLFQAGAYINRTDTVEKKIIENTLAVVNQTNNFKTDRRLLYYQHSNNYFSSLNFFLSAEADLYKKINEVEQNELSLTGFFLSARYSPASWTSLSLSYDARRNVIFYETFRNFIETLLDNEMRQGLRGSINFRPFSTLYTGINLGYRFRKGDPRPSNDIGAYISYSSLPYINASPSLSYSRIRSSYISGDIYGLSLSKSIEFLNSSLNLGYRNSSYDYSGNGTSNQHSVSADVSTRITKQIYFSLGWDGIFEGNRTNGRILLDLSSRL